MQTQKMTQKIDQFFNEFCEEFGVEPISIALHVNTDLLTLIREARENPDKENVHVGSSVLKARSVFARFNANGSTSRQLTLAADVE